MTYEQLKQKLANPYWTPYPTSKYLNNWQGKIAQFNMYYVLRGRFSSQAKGSLSENMDYWHLAGRIVLQPTTVGPVADSILVMTPVEFYDHMVCTRTVLFSKFLNIQTWQRILNETQQDSEPALTAFDRALLAGKSNH